MIGGDFNVNFQRNYPLKNVIKNLMLTYNFYQIVNEPTRITSSSSSCIDLLFINFRDSNNLLNIQDFGFSDHKGILFYTSVGIKSPKQFFTLKRVFSERNMDKFRSELRGIRWDEILGHENNINTNYNVFNGTKNIKLMHS